MTPKDNEIRRRLTLVREWKDMTQAEFCRATGISQTLWSMIEGGTRKCSHRNLSKIKSAFSVPFDWLYDGDITEQIPNGLLKYVNTKLRMD